MSDFFELDKHALDNEWVVQPKLYHEYATKLAEARTEYERAKTDRDLVYAEIYRDIKADPQKYGVEKVTEDGVKNLIPLQARHRKSTEVVLNAKHAVDVLQVAVETLDHRKKALENLVSLHLANYYSSPRAPEGARERMGEAERRAAFGKKRREADSG